MNKGRVEESADALRLIAKRNHKTIAADILEEYINEVRPRGLRW